MYGGLRGPWFVSRQTGDQGDSRARLSGHPFDERLEPGIGAQALEIAVGRHEPLVLEAGIDGPAEPVEVGSLLLVVGFPLGFHDALHHLPVVRHAVNASSFGMRFQGKGYFLTDARTHRGTSGAPVVMRATKEGLGDLPWMLLGIHSSRMDVGTRDLKLDEALGLNCAWYADILMTLTKD